MTDNDNSAEGRRFETLLDRGMSREKAARLVNSEAASGTLSAKEPESYDDWTDEELYRHAGELGVEDRYGMGRDELIAAIRGQ